MRKSVQQLTKNARSRVSSRTIWQDVCDPLSGEVDRRKLANQFVNVENAIDDLAHAVEQVAGDEGSAA